MAAQLNDSDEIMTGINVTPLVDVTLVLLVILMITASYVVSKSIPMSLPKSATGEASAPKSLSVSIDREGKLYLDAEAVDESTLRARMRTAHASDPELQAVIAADGQTDHSQVVHVMDLLRQEQITNFAINVQPEDLKR
jgi:biopolymer transport protein ExbD